MTRRRGSVYVPALGASVMVAIIGLSALFVARMQTRITSGATEEARARHCAESVIDLARFRLAADPDWRTTYAGAGWTAQEAPANGLLFQYKLVDEEDGDLENDATQPAPLYAMTTAGDAVRLCSVLLQPPDLTNLLTNPGFEDGATDWLSWDCTLVPSAGGRSGASCLLLQNRTAPDSAVGRYVESHLTNGQSYAVSVWAKTVSGTDSVDIRLKLDATVSGNTAFSTNPVVVGTTWTRISGILTPSWTGTLSQATLLVSCHDVGGSTDSYVDEILLAEQAGQAPAIVPGSWRRETQP